jgi:HAD superfamily hydrolase (TIGR01509 family)
MYARAEKAYAERIVLKEGVMDYIRKLTEAGHCCCVLTASPHRCVDPCLARNGIASLFQHVWTMEDFTTLKSDPTIYRDAAERMGTPIEKLYFYDDNLVALTAAKEAGAQVVGVYDPCSDPFRKEIEALCPQYVETFKELC